MVMILDAFVERLNGLLVQLVEEKVTMLLGVDDEISSLLSTIETVSTVLADAERKMVDSKAVDLWPKKLKDIMYDADDIVDLCRIEAEKHHSSSSSSSSSTSVVRCNLSFSSCLPVPSCFRNPVYAYKIGTRVKGLNFRLEKISKEMDGFGLLHLRNNLGNDVRLSEVSDKASSLVEAELVGSGIHEDTQKMVDFLTRQDDRENVLVFAIVGMGGIGKTTRAQLIYNDDTIKGHFQLRFWVSVTPNFDEDTLLREAVSSAGVGHSGAVSRSQLEKKLEDVVRGKKFMLVLDDVWEKSVWDRLLSKPFSRGATGSRVLMTTRNEEVARTMKAVYSHLVTGLPSEDGWSLLCKRLVLSGEEAEMEELKDIGLEIVKKCKGGPLAILAMVGPLSTKSRSDWENVLRSSAWSVSGLPEQVNRALYLSYLHLPSHLKQCFLYCSLLPKGINLHKNFLVQLWIAEGLIDGRSELSVSMEDTGERYCRELMWRSMLKSVVEGLDSSYKMHELQRSLAEFLAQDESMFVKEPHEYSLNTKNERLKLRCLSIVGGEVQQQQQVDVLISCKESLRTLFLRNNQSKHLNGVLDNLPFLRVLQLKGSNIEELPDSLTGLARLRYLGLSETPITALPERIGDLKNLQFLDLCACQNLACLPNSIVALKNLRGLSIENTTIKGIPAGIGSLCHLSYLAGYRLQPSDEGEITTDTASTGKCNSWSTLEDLGPLLQLRHLAIDNLESAPHCMEAAKIALMEKSRLRNLFLSCTDDWIREAAEDDLRRTEEIFHVLQPPSCVELLMINGFPGRSFPNWMMSVAYSCLKMLHLKNCIYCENLPPLGRLPNLLYFVIDSLLSIKSIGPEFMGVQGSKSSSTTSVAFPKLLHLDFANMPKWEEWQWERELHAMPCLQKLVLSKCPILISIPSALSHHATALTKLKIEDCHWLKSVENFGSLKEVKAINCCRLEKVFDLPKLNKLVIRKCPSLNVVGNLCSLRRMKLMDYEMESLPQWLVEDAHSPKPEKIDIRCNTQLFQKICQKKEEEWTKFQHIGHVDVYCENDQGHASYSKEPFSFTTQFSSTASSGTSQLSSLPAISITSTDPVVVS